MIDRRLAGSTSLLLLGLLPSPGHSMELPSRASLAELSAVGHVVAIVPVGANGDESALREVVERRLEAAGITIDPSVDSRLVAKVELARHTSPTGERHFSYRISLSLEEPARTVRQPHTTFYATTWSGTASVTRFQRGVSFDVLLDQFENKVGAFLATVARDTQAAANASADR